jgi:protein subunit release factor A
MKKYIEIKAAEGGEDSALFVQDIHKLYGKLCNRYG